MKLKILILLIGFAPVFSWANEDAPPAAEGGGEEPAAETKTEVKDPNAKQNREYQDKTAKLKVLQARIATAEKSLMELAHKKNAEKNPALQKEIMDEMVTIVQDRNKAVDQHNLLKTELTYRFPSKGETLDRTYRTQSKKTIEEIEGSIGLDELLTRTKKMIERKYAPFNPPKKVVVPAAASTHTSDSGVKTAPSVAQPEEEKPKPLRLER